MLKLSPNIILQIISFLDMFSMGLILPQLGNHARELGFNHIQIGFMGALYSACQMISAPIIGSLSDIKGSKNILLLCCIVCSVSYFCLGVTTSIIIFYLLRATLGLFKQTQLLSKTVVADIEKDKNKQGVIYGTLMSLGGLGMASGPVVGGHIIEAYPGTGFTILTYIIMLMFLLNTGLTTLLPTTLTEKKQKHKDSVAPKLLESMAGTLKESVNEFYKVDWSIYWDVFLYKLLITLTMGLYYSNFAIFLKTEHGVSPKNLGYIVAMQGVVGAISTYCIGHINSMYKNDVDCSQRNFHVFLTIAISIAGLATAPSMLVFLPFLIPKTIAGNVCRIVSLEALNNRSQSGQKGAVIGASNSVKSLSGVITPVIGGFVTQYLGVTYALLIAASISGIGALISYIQRSKSIKEKTK